jgi:Fe-S cluster biogenesis protein NfuA
MIRHPPGVEDADGGKLNDFAWPTGSLEDRVVFAIEEVRPAINADGGDIVLRGIDGSTVTVSLKGACSNCAMAHSTLADFVAERIKLYAPEITDVVAE